MDEKGLYLRLIIIKIISSRDNTKQFRFPKIRLQYNYKTMQFPRISWRRQRHGEQTTTDHLFNATFPKSVVEMKRPKVSKPIDQPDQQQRNRGSKNYLHSW